MIESLLSNNTSNRYKFIRTTTRGKKLVVSVAEMEL